MWSGINVFRQNVNIILAETNPIICRIKVDFPELLHGQQIHRPVTMVVLNGGHDNKLLICVPSVVGLNKYIIKIRPSREDLRPSREDLI